MGFLSNIVNEGKRVVKRASDAPGRFYGGVSGALRGGGLSNVIGNLSQAANPLGTDKIGDYLHGVSAQFLDPNYTEESQDDLFKQFKTKLPQANQPTDQASQARLSAFATALSEAKRKRGVSTLLTGGHGAMGSAITSSPAFRGF